MQDTKTNNQIPALRGGFYYNNELWFSDAYQSLLITTRNLLHCFIGELRWDGKGKNKVFINNGKLAFTESQFKKLYGYCSATYIKARNQLIKVGLIEQVFRGGEGRGNCARYRLLCVDGVSIVEQKWRKYPSENWIAEIPKSKNSLVGVKTRFQSHKSKQKVIFHPAPIGGLIHKTPTRLYPYEN